MPQPFEIFTFLFLMLGPFKILGPFAQMTEHASKKLANQIALQSTIFAIAGVLLAAILGENILDKFGIPVPILALTGGLILFLVALSNVLQQYTPVPKTDDKTVPTIRMALNPLAFPTIVTPYGIAAVIVFMTISPGLNEKLIIGAIVIGIMVINLIAMMLTRYIGKFLFLFLSILGSVLGVVQVALGLMIVYNQLKVMFHFTGI